MSRGVRDHIRQLGSFRFEDLGEQQVKNIDRPVRAFPGHGRRQEGFQMRRDAARSAGAVDARRRPTKRSLLDLAMWETMSGSDQVPEFLHYLERFPEGEFAALARDRIATLVQAPRRRRRMPADTAVELAFWESVKDSDNPALYEA